MNKPDRPLISEFVSFNQIDNQKKSEIWTERNAESYPECEVLKTGALMLSKRYFFNKAYNSEQLAELRQYVSARLAPIQADLNGTHLQNAAATSGTAKAIARMIHLDRTKETLADPHGFRFSAAELYAVELELCRLIEPERIAIRWGLDSKRADIVLAGCVILATLTRFLQIPQWHISRLIRHARMFHKQ